MKRLLLFSLGLGLALTCVRAAPGSTPTPTSGNSKPNAVGTPSSSTIGQASTQPGAPFRPTIPSKDPNAITPQQWQELNTARVAAMKANPALMQKAVELSSKMKAFQQKLDAAIVKVDPNTAPIIARLEHGMPGQRLPMPPAQGERPNFGSPPPSASPPPNH